MFNFIAVFYTDYPNLQNGSQHLLTEMRNSHFMTKLILRSNRRVHI